MRISDWSSDVCSSDLEQPLAAALAPGAHRNLPGRDTDVDQLPAEAPCRFGQFGNIGEARVHAGDQVEPGLSRLDQRTEPTGVENPPTICDPEPTRTATGRYGEE